MNIERINQLKKYMKGQGLDALVLSMPGHINIVSGFLPLNNGLACYVLPSEGNPLCIVPHCDAMEAKASLWGADMEIIKFGVIDAPDYGAEFENKLKDCASKTGLKKIGHDLGSECFAPAWNLAEINFFHGSRLKTLERVFGADSVVDVSAALGAMKQCKTAFEIEMIRKANEIAAIGIKKFRETVKPGISGLELRVAVESAVDLQGAGYKGAKRVRAFAQVSTGPQETRWGFRPMVDSTTRKMESGDIALLEMAVVADGYWSDRTEAVVAGEQTARQKEVISLIKKARKAVISGLKPGMTCADADSIARDMITEAGYGKDFIHITGHGVGLQYHDPGPFLMPGNDAVLEAGSVVTVEPGVYFEGFGGIRFEDNVVITAQGAEVLGPLV